MAWFLYLISATWIAYGSCAILYTPQTKEMAREFLSKFNPRVISAFPFISGILFLMAASSGSHPWIIRAFGVIAMAKGAFVFLIHQNFYTKTIEWYLDALSDQAHRFVGIISIILGTALLSWII